MSSNIDKLKSQSLRRRKTALNDIRRVRNRKLAQLYCISNFPYTSLAEDDVSKISSYLQEFITEHSLEKGKQMTEVSLLGNKHVLENILTNSRGLGQDRKNQEKQNNLPGNEQASTSLEKESGSQPSVASKQQQNSLWNELNSKRKMSASSTNNNNTTLSGSETRKSRRQSKPTPQEVTSFELSKIQQLNLLSEKLSKVLTNDIFIEDKNHEDLLYMLMNENMPTTISPAIPLSKLFYYSRSLQLVKLLVNSNKVLTTNLFESSFLEGKISVVHSRIDELQKQHKWCLKQPKRYIDPFTVNENKQINRSHWDNLLLESSWMAQDFKEGRKYKIATCLMIANAVMDYFKLGKEATCIKRKPIKFLSDEKSGFEFTDNHVETATDGGMNFEEFISNDILGFELEDEVPEDQYNVDINVNSVANKDELDMILNENEVKIPENILEDGIQSFVDPQQLHDLENTNEIHQEINPKYYNIKENFPFNLTASDNYISNPEKLVLDKLELYTPFGNEKNTVFQNKSDVSMNLLGNEFKISDIVPVSKLTLPEESEQGWFKLVKKNKDREDENNSATNNIEVKGLFSGSSARRNNINIIKPPLPPSTIFLDARSPTIWVPEDDKLLLRLCKLYHNNWYVVSSQLSAKLSNYSYVANISRRTPWQCFERFSQLTSSFPQDLRGAYSQQAQNWFEQSRKLQISTKKRIWPLGVGKSSIQRGHRKLKWASMFEAMRRALKKRENMPKPVTAPASFRKQVSAEDRAKILSPLDLSKLKFGDFDSKLNHNRSNGGDNNLDLNSNNTKASNSNFNPKIPESQIKSNTVSRRESSKSLNDNEKLAKMSKSDKKTKLKQTSKNKVKSNPEIPNDTNISKGPKEASVNANSSASNISTNSGDANMSKDLTSVSTNKNSKKRPYTEITDEKDNESISKKPAILSSENITKTNDSNNIAKTITTNNTNNNTSNFNGNVDVQKYFTTSYVSSVISDIQTKHPEWNKEEVRNAAARKIAQLHNQIKILQQKKIQKQKQEALQRQQQLNDQKLVQAASNKVVNSVSAKVPTDSGVAGMQEANRFTSNASEIKSQTSDMSNNNNSINLKNNNGSSDKGNHTADTNVSIANNTIINSNSNTNMSNTNNDLKNNNSSKVKGQLIMNPALSNVLAKLPPSVRTIFENTNIADFTPEQKVEFINKIKKQMKEHGMYGNTANSNNVPSSSTGSSLPAVTTNSNISNSSALSENKSSLINQNKDEISKNDATMPSITVTEAKSSLVKGNSNMPASHIDNDNNTSQKEADIATAEATISKEDDESQGMNQGVVSENSQNNETTFKDALNSNTEGIDVASSQNTSSVESIKFSETSQDNDKQNSKNEDNDIQNSKSDK